jgi:hypothetical protein
MSLVREIPGKMRMSKGSDYRPFNKEKFNKNFDRIFKKKKSKKKTGERSGK